ncbi:MAG: hypothetical protein JXX14_01870, partial [Deltaproteobacteria bacterium]|nr:hypothetical protein [Deltaproteobacteria bacterium]
YYTIHWVLLTDCESVLLSVSKSKIPKAVGVGTPKRKNCRGVLNRTNVQLREADSIESQMVPQDDAH